MGWVVCSDAVLESRDTVLIIVVTASRCICDAVSSHCREILEPCWCRFKTWVNPSASYQANPNTYYAFKECLTYYALANGFSLWYERSCEARVVAKCGQRPPRLFDPEKGKQRKQTRFYVCFAGLADGWKTWCRKIIALDGYFLKSPNQGEYLLQLEGMRKITFTQWLGQCRGNGLTLMSDQHKGLKDDVKDVLPNTEHRKCARHIYENFRKQYPRKWNPGVCPNIKKRLEWLKEQQRIMACRIYCSVGILFEVRLWSEGFTVDERRSLYYVPAWFEIDMYYVAYHNFVKLVPGMNFWPDKSMYSTVLPPKPRKMPGRPRKKRIRAIGEGGSSTRVSKAGVPGRPRKKQSVGDVEDVDVVLRGLMRDEGAGGSRGCAGRSRGGVSVSRGGASVYRGGASVSRGGAGGSKGGVGGSRMKLMSSAGT
ncbi:multidrug resistance-associated protein 5 [Tanacetum coccineum]